ncbi:MAG: aldehyde dehydrogenase family protein [Planctomycetes bacterium]|nr:aldehyde dehydrogenase family protein [Planctomycetota bacterium]
MKMFVAGEWVAGEQQFEVRNPFDGSVIDTVPSASASDLERALAGMVRGAVAMRKMPAYDRGAILRRAGEIMSARQAELGSLISREEGKTVAEGQFEVGRAIETMMLSAEEARRMNGEVLPLDAAPGGGDRLGFTVRVPCGIVAAITPFNFPLNLVCHKVGPALAAGNAVIVKPASDTPLSALQLVKFLLEAGLPADAIACVTGRGRAIGDQLCRDSRVRKISFTGSSEVGKSIVQAAGLKRVTMELGSNSPLIVLPDADLERVAAAVVATGYGNAGQVCISTQRVIATRPVYRDLLDLLTPRIAAIPAGDPLDPTIRMGPMIREDDARRVLNWIEEATNSGARVLCGGERQGTLVAPTLVAEVTPDMRLSREELFGPAVGVTAADSLEHALTLANDSRFGLSAGIFTRDINAALRFIRDVDSGSLHVNWGPGWRADLMPYGGLKESGMGKEGPAYAVQEMSEWKTVVIHGS